MHSFQGSKAISTNVSTSISSTISSTITTTSTFTPTYPPSSKVSFICASTFSVNSTATFSATVTPTFSGTTTVNSTDSNESNFKDSYNFDLDAPMTPSIKSNNHHGRGASITVNSPSQRYFSNTLGKGPVETRSIDPVS